MNKLTYKEYSQDGYTTHIRIKDLNRPILCIWERKPQIIKKIMIEVFAGEEPHERS